MTQLTTQTQQVLNTLIEQKPSHLGKLYKSLDVLD